MNTPIYKTSTNTNILIGYKIMAPASVGNGNIFLSICCGIMGFEYRLNQNKHRTNEWGPMVIFRHFHEALDYAISNPDNHVVIVKCEYTKSEHKTLWDSCGNRRDILNEDFGNDHDTRFERAIKKTQFADDIKPLQVVFTIESDLCPAYQEYMRLMAERREENETN